MTFPDLRKVSTQVKGSQEDRRLHLRSFLEFNQLRQAILNRRKVVIEPSWGKVEPQRKNPYNTRRNGLTETCCRLGQARKTG